MVTVGFDAVEAFAGHRIECSSPASFERREICGRGLSVFIDARLGNSCELSANLGLPATSSAAEIVAAAYFRWGSDFVDRLDGDFAIALIDRANNIVHLVRDHVGIKQLAYSHSKNALIFGNDLGEIAKRLDTIDLDDGHVASVVLGGTGFHPARTFLKSIKRVPPGAILSFDGRAFCSRTYWAPGQVGQARYTDDREIVEAGRALLEKAVADRLPQKKRVAFHVTGGLDSSAIIALAKTCPESCGLDRVGYAWERPANHGEGPRVEAARQLLDAELHCPEPSLEQITDLWRLDWTVEPSAWNLMHETAVQQAAHNDGVETVFSGWGGDEAISFNGRGLYAHYLRTGQLGELARLSGKGGFTGLARGLKIGWQQAGSHRQPLSGNPELSYLSADFLSAHKPEKSPNIDWRDPRKGMVSLMGVGAVTARIEDWAVSGRKLGLEYRYPLLDRKVLDFAYSVPPHVFRQGTTKRWLFREMLRGILPEQIRCESSKREPNRTDRMIAKVRQSMCGLADEIEDRRSTLSRAPYFDIDRLVTALRSEISFGDPRLGHMRRALQFLDL